MLLTYYDYWGREEALRVFPVQAQSGPAGPDALELDGFYQIVPGLRTSSQVPHYHAQRRGKIFQTRFWAGLGTDDYDQAADSRAVARAKAVLRHGGPAPAPPPPSSGGVRDARLISEPGPTTHG